MWTCSFWAFVTMNYFKCLSQTLGWPWSSQWFVAALVHSVTSPFPQCCSWQFSGDLLINGYRVPHIHIPNFPATCKKCDRVWYKLFKKLMLVAISVGWKISAPLERKNGPQSSKNVPFKLQRPLLPNKFLNDSCVCFKRIMAGACLRYLSSALTVIQVDDTSSDT